MPWRFCVGLKLGSGVDHNIVLAGFLHCEAVEDNAVGGNVDGGGSTVDLNADRSLGRDDDSAEDGSAGDDLTVLDHLVVGGSAGIGEALQLILEGGLVVDGDDADGGISFLEEEYVNTKVSAIEEGCVKAMQGEEEISIPCDMVVMAVGSKKNVLDLEGVTVPVYYAGDCSGERTAGIMEAVRGGYKAANEV